MQEEVDQKTIALAVNTTKMTGRVLAKAIQMYLQHHKDKSKNPKIYHGKQTIKQLMKQNAALSNIEITDKNIRSFESVAKKYNIDYGESLRGRVSGMHHPSDTFKKKLVLCIS